MQEDLAYCVREFNDLVKRIEDIQNGQPTMEKITKAESFINIILDIIKETMIEVLQDQEEKESESHENPTNASTH
ncbi:MAG: hypothetical protein E6276_06165 [Clostridiales bacterium]|nr:hypothetical protein [Clostridiales bacterium]